MHIYAYRYWHRYYKSNEHPLLKCKLLLFVLPALDWSCFCLLFEGCLLISLRCNKEMEEAADETKLRLFFCFNWWLTNFQLELTNINWSSSEFVSAEHLHRNPLCIISTSQLAMMKQTNTFLFSFFFSSFIQISNFSFPFKYIYYY